MEDKVGTEVAIRSDRYRDGRIVTLEKDRWGIFWSDNWHKERPEDEDNLEMFELVPIKLPDLSRKLK